MATTEMWGLGVLAAVDQFVGTDTRKGVDELMMIQMTIFTGSEALLPNTFRDNGHQLQ